MSKYQFNYYKNIEVFERDKERLKLECDNLELQIQNKWISLKHSLSPKNIGEQIISKFIEKKKQNLFDKILDINYLSEFILKKSNSLITKIKSFFSR